MSAVYLNKWSCRPVTNVRNGRVTGQQPLLYIRPALSKKLFPVSQGGLKKIKRPVRRLGFSSFFPPNFISLTRMYRSGSKYKNMKRKVTVGPF